jgi:hypothetical protein
MLDEIVPFVPIVQASTSVHHGRMGMIRQQEKDDSEQTRETANKGHGRSLARNGLSGRVLGGAEKTRQSMGKSLRYNLAHDLSRDPP